jgi:ankyrin repeat protein
MSIKTGFIAGTGSCLLTLLGVFAVAATDDLALVDAAARGDIAAVKAALSNKTDVNRAQPDGATALSWAVHGDDLEMADLLIRAGADVNAANDYGVSPLALACTNRSVAMVEKLLKASANPNVANWTGETPLMTCIATGSVEAVKVLLDFKADPNTAEDKRGQTPLMWAVAKKQSEIVELLVDHKAAVSARSSYIPTPEPFNLPCSKEQPCRNGKMEGFSYGPNFHYRKTVGGFTPLMFAAQQGDIESAKILLEAGANVDESTLEDGSALVVAAASGNEEMAAFLLSRGANPDAKDGYGITPLHYAFHQSLLQLIGTTPRPTDVLGWTRPNMPGLAKVLLTYGADVNARIEYDIPPYEEIPIARAIGNNMPQISLIGVTPFLLATGAGDLDMMRYLVEARANPLLSTESGATPVLIAAGLGRERANRKQEDEDKKFLEALKQTIALGGDVNVADKSGRTALHMAVMMGAAETIKYLVEKGANLEAKDKYGQTPLTIALGDPEGLIFRPLAGGGHDFTFRRRSNDKQEKIAQLLLDLGAKPFTGQYKVYGD